MSDLMDEQRKDDSGETEYMWDSTDEQDEEDTKKKAYMWDSMDIQDECWGFNFHLRSKDGITQEITVTNRSYTVHLL